jgi:mRNA-degrading endonuclease YafQ of YafQ-DinJ toxin-antitoxin module
MYKVRLLDKVIARRKEIEEELRRGDRRNEREYKLLLKGIERLKWNYKFGAHISRKKHPAAFNYYRNKYGIEFDNLWKLNVSSDWRMIYTIVSSEVEVISFILDLVDHKQYDRIFGYHTT